MGENFGNESLKEENDMLKRELDKYKMENVFLRKSIIEILRLSGGTVNEKTMNL